MVNPVDGAVMVYVPEGEFLMGSEDPDALVDEKPKHTVYLDAFWIYQTEVTNSQYRACVDAGECDAPRDESYFSDSNYEDHPVVYVTWHNANAYCTWAGGRLPTEAEWEKAARGTDGRKFPWGDSPVTGDKANYCDVNCQNFWADTAQDDGYATTAPVGSYPDGASPGGALDMAGNVFEWVADWFDEGYYSNAPYENPTGPASGQLRVLRGGSYYFDETLLRVSFRNRVKPIHLSYDFGFRCLRPEAP